MIKPKDLTSQKFGRLLVIGKGEDYFSKKGKKTSQIRCRCDCGNIVDLPPQRLISGNTVSCGCYKKEMLIRNATIHGYSKTKLYSVWASMKDRCFRENSRFYDDYGGRGITVCDEWLDFKTFHEWATKNGYREGLTIERKDNDNGYFPDNCKWIPQSEQMRNRRNCVYMSHGGKTHTVSEWARIFRRNHRSVLEYYRKYGEERTMEFYIAHCGLKEESTHQKEVRSHE